MSIKQTQQYIANVTNFGNCGNKIAQNAPKEYNSRQHQYMADRTQRFAANRAWLTSDYANADVQGLTEDFYEYVNTDIRLAESSTQNVTSLFTKKSDDYREVLLPELGIDYIPIGAKINTMGSTWLVINTSNISSVNATAVVCRCNASYSYYDYYGNIKTEPIIVERMSMLANPPITPLNTVEMHGYFVVMCQLNDITDKLSENSRIILGKKAYTLSGYTDFIQEFTGDYDSCHLCSFTARVEEPVADDDISNHIANGLSYSYSANISGKKELSEGTSSTLSAIFVKNGENILPTEKNPLNWIWTSSDKDVLTVDNEGNITAVSVGSAFVTVELAQNKAIKATAEVQVVEAQTEPYLTFTGFVAQSITQYQSATFTVEAFFENRSTGNGETQLIIQPDGSYMLDVHGALVEARPYEDNIYKLIIEDPVFLFTDADCNSYTAVQNGNSVTITCNGASRLPLTIIAKFGEYTISTSVKLLSY